MLAHRAKASPEKFASATYSRSAALIQRQYAKSLRSGLMDKGRRLSYKHRILKRLNLSREISDEVIELPTRRELLCRAGSHRSRPKCDVALWANSLNPQDRVCVAVVSRPAQGFLHPGGHRVGNSSD